MAVGELRSCRVESEPYVKVGRAASVYVSAAGKTGTSKAQVDGATASIPMKSTQSTPMTMAADDVRWVDDNMLCSTWILDGAMEDLDASLVQGGVSQSEAATGAARSQTGFARGAPVGKTYPYPSNPCGRYRVD